MTVLDGASVYDRASPPQPCGKRHRPVDDFCNACRENRRHHPSDDLTNEEIRGKLLAREVSDLTKWKERTSAWFDAHAWARRLVIARWPRRRVLRPRPDTLPASERVHAILKAASDAAAGKEFS